MERPHAPGTAPRSSFFTRLGPRPKILTVGAVGLLGMAALGATSAWSLTVMDAAADEINAANHIQTSAQKLKADVYNLKRTQNRYMLQAHVDGKAVADPANPSRATYLGALKSTEADLAAFPALKLEKSKAALADLENSYQAFKASDDRVITLVGQGKIAEAQKVTLGESTEAATKAADASDALIAAVQTRVDDAVAAKASAKTTASLVMLGVALLVAALLVTLALWIARGILVAVNSVRATLEAMGRGDLTVPAQATTQDEVGRMALAAEATRASMQDVMAQVGDASTTVATASEELTAVSS